MRAVLILWLLGVSAIVANEPVKVRADALGDPLPPHATTRLGSARWRQEWSHGVLVYNSAGQLLAAGRGDGVGLWDLASSKKLRHWSAAKQYGLPHSVTISADQKVLAAVGGDQDLVIEVFDVDSSKTRKTWTAPERVYGLVLSPDGSYLATLHGTYLNNKTWAHEVRIWHTTGATQIHHFKGIGGAAVFSHDGKTILLGSDKHVSVRDFTSGKELRRIEGRAKLLALSADGSVLAGAGDDGIQLWNPATGERLRTFKAALGKHSYLTLAADGKSVAFATEDATFVWDVATGKERYRGPGVSWRGSVALSADGRSLAWTGSSKVHRWDLAAGREIVLTPGHSCSVYSLGFSPDGGRLVSRGADNVIYMWKFKDDQLAPILKLRHSETNYIIGWEVTFSHDGKHLATRSMKHIRLLDAETGKDIGKFAGSPNGTRVEFSGDDSMLAIDDAYTAENGEYLSRIHLWDVKAGKRLRTIDSSAVAGRAFAFSRDDKLLATTGDAVRLWDLATGKQVRRLPGAVHAVAFAPDRDTLVAGGGDSVTLWSLKSGDQIRQWRVGRLLALALAPDGKILATAIEDAIHLWDMASGAKLAQLTGHASWIHALAFSPDGKRLASGSDDTTILLWDVPAALQAARLKTKQAAVPANLETLWADLARSNAGPAYKAIWGMAAEPARTVGFLKERMKAPDKGHADEVVVPAGKALQHLRGIEVLERIGTPEAKALLDKLAQAPASRFSREAQAALRRLDQARPVAIKPRQEATGAERTEKIWNDLGEADAFAAHKSIWALVEEPDEAIKLLRSRLKPAAQEEADKDAILIPAGDTLRAVRAVTVLEHIASADARKILEVLADGPPARLTREARAALERLKKRK
jgi:WD40 repeat protein